MPFDEEMTERERAEKAEAERDRIDSAARVYRHTVHSKVCNCKACVELLKALAAHKEEQDGRGA